MSKRLCKMNRKQIAANLGDIHRLVVAPKFVCRSCARSSASKDSLCKPAAIPPQKCQDKPLSEQQACGLLAEALPTPSLTQDSPIIMAPEQSAEKAAILKRVVERVKEKKLAVKVTAVTPATQLETPAMFDLSDKKALKKAKKAVKKHYKQQKKLLKLAEKKIRVERKQKRILEDFNDRGMSTFSEEKLH
ncbi:hypothetical protein [Vibrio parahaemolyticus]|uniref:hypothetical protein n=1 Tax=Vibrio parahaemolyticus TaxID=670 RepID=UPI0025549166|nr:hypothetical protein [Vibrio parahaemolyticus]